MSLIKSIVALSTVSLLSGCIVVASASNADFHNQRQLTLSASDINALHIESGAGSLIVRGKEGLTEIQLSADIYTSASDRNNFELTLKKSGNKAYLIANIPRSFGSWIGSSPHIDVVVDVPQQLMLAINDGSGDIKISDLNAFIEIKDGSGDLSINDINANIEIDDGSGDLSINDIVGNIDINDGSGELSVTNIVGNVNIVDNSGEMVLKNITGNLAIEDGSGGIYVQKITGSVGIEDDSGDLIVRQVGGVVTIEDGSGDIDVETTGGLKILASGSGDLRIKDINGKLDIDS
ncbi:MAG: DUF4097 and DUF4098 domain-containing protein YvlB [Alteromonadaceae bacterium]|jgi:DUF4097 and DUF4098 domain-containing protein YvlB